MNETKRARRIQVTFVLSAIAFVVAATLMVTGDRGLIQWLSLASTFSTVMALGLLLRVESRRD